MTENIQEEVENKIIDCINSGITGRLIIFKPEKIGQEDYLAVERRGKYKEEGIYLQINILVGPSEADNFVKDFSQESFNPAKNFYLLFVYFDEVRQKISDYIWLIPSTRFGDAAKVVKSAAGLGKGSLRFEASLDPAKKNQYSKFLVEAKGLGKIILNALEKGRGVDFKKIDWDEKRKVNLENLKNFLCEARRNTYAVDASPIDNPRLLASKQLEFQKGDYFYRDVFFSGDKRFIGQEIVYQDLKPVWGMSYIGSQIGKLETVFLRESLFKLAEKCRLGLICDYEKREFKYRDRGQGSLEEFSGEEGIFSAGRKIYKLNYQGGLISDKL